MNKLLLTLLPALILMGCAQTRMESLSMIKGLELSYDESGNETINKYTTSTRALNNSGSIEACVALAISNKSIALRDGADGFVNAYPRYYYNLGNTISVPGGETIKYADNNVIVVDGVTDYVESGLTRYVRYTALISRRGNEIIYSFSNIEQARQDTGVMPNRGFSRVSSRTEDRPDKVAAALNRETEKVHNCLVTGQASGKVGL